MSTMLLSFTCALTATMPIGAMFRLPQKSSCMSLLLSPNNWTRIGKRGPLFYTAYKTYRSPISAFAQVLQFIYFWFQRTEDPTTSFTFSCSASWFSIMSITFGASASLTLTFIQPTGISIKWNLCYLLMPLTIPNAAFYWTLYRFMSHTSWPIMS